jgi:hypothetical protein
MVDTPRSQSTEVSTVGRGVTVRSRTPAGPSLSFRIPAGILFALPGAILLFLYPRQPYWIGLWGYQMILGTLCVGLLAVGIGWTDWAFRAVHILSGPFCMGTSLAAPLLVYGLQAEMRDDSSSPETDPMSAQPSTGR